MSLFHLGRSVLVPSIGLGATRLTAVLLLSPSVGLTDLLMLLGFVANRVSRAVYRVLFVGRRTSSVASLLRLLYASSALYWPVCRS